MGKLRTRLAKEPFKFQEPGKYDAHDRKEIPEDDFGDPKGKKFPIVVQKDVDDAAKLIGHAKDPEAVKKRIIDIAKRKGFKLPDSWQAELDAKDKTANRILNRMQRM